MSALFASMLALVAAAGLEGAEPHHVDASLDLRGELLDHRFVDVDADGRLELVLALRTRGGGRELRLHRVADVRIEPEPFATVRVLEDVLAYGFADVREEAGRELLFLTRSGVHSYSTTKEGYRDNVRRLLESELLYDVPDPRALPYWSYVLSEPRGDLVLVPAPSGLEIWAKPSGEDPPTGEYERISSLLGAVSSARGQIREGRGGRRRNGSRGGGASIEIDENESPFVADAFPGARERVAGSFLSDARAIQAPAVVDLDRDGRLDLLLRRGSEFAFHRNEGGHFAAQPTRVESLPEYLSSRGREVDLSLVDLDGDGDLDLLAEIHADADGFENVEHSLLVLLHEDERLFPAQPSQILRFEAGVMRAEVADANADGRPDLVVRLFELPSLVETVTTIEFELTHLLYLGTGESERPFERKPALRQSEQFDEDSVGAAAANRMLRLDCDGDGLPDLVEVDLEGYVAIRRLRLESGFLRGKGWELDVAPWKRFPVRGSIESLDVLDLNGDGLGDVVSEGDDVLAILLSVDPRRGEGRR